MDMALSRLIFRMMQGLGRLPRPLTRRLGNLLGDAGFRMNRRRRKIALDNLAFALGAELDAGKRRFLARDAYRNMAQILFEIGRSIAVPVDEIARCIRIDGLEHYRTALAKGRGVVFITGHLGNWEILPFVSKIAGIQTNIVYRPLDFKPLDLFFGGLRSRFGARLIKSSHAMLPVMRALKRKEAVVILIDQSVDWYDGIWVDFFGRRTCTSNGVALIAGKVRCPVLPAFLYREGDGFRAVMGPEIPLAASGDKTKDLQVNTLSYSKAIEHGIRRHPEQWFWVHRRWKNRPYCPWPGGG